MRSSRLWFGVIALGSLAAILVTRLAPFDFVWAGRVPWERVMLAPLTMRDVPLNVLLFVPLGLGLAGLLATADRRLPTAEEGARGQGPGGGGARSSPGTSPLEPGTLSGGGRRSAVGGRVLVAALLLSAALEAIQMFMPERAPSVADVIANGLGALAGVGLYRAWAMGFGRALDRYATRRNLLIGLSVYALGAALLTAYLYRSAGLDNWDTSFPLVVGNEAVGKRQWSGRVESVELAAGLPDSPDFAARYDFRGAAPYTNGSDPAGPSLAWQEGPATAQVGAGVNVGPGEWLATNEPFGNFATAARRFDAFVIRATVATADPAQRGPARIVSISADANRRNVTLGQEKDALIIRLRTPAGGENGQKPEVLVPGVFSDGRQREIRVDYEAPLLKVKVDGEERSLSLAPGLAFFPGFATENRYPVVMTGDPHRYDYAYWGLVVGLGVLVFGGLGVGKRMNRTRITRMDTDKRH